MKQKKGSGKNPNKFRDEHKRLLGPIGYIPPAEAEAGYYRCTSEQALAAWLK